MDDDGNGVPGASGHPLGSVGWCACGCARRRKGLAGVDLLIVFVVILVAPVVLVIGALMLRFLLERSRRASMRSWAEVNGWSFQPRSFAPWTDLLPGRNRHGLHATFARQFEGHWVTVAEYAYQTAENHRANEMYWGADIHSGPRRYRTPSNAAAALHRFVVVAIQLGGVYSAVAVHHRDVFSRMDHALAGYGQIATGNVAFDSRFRIAAPDAACAASLIGPALIAAHTTESVPPWTLLGPNLVSCFPIQVKFHPATVPAYAASLLGVAGLLGR